MDHARYRMLISADPNSRDPELREHRDGCPECRLYTERLLHFESRLERALKLDVPTRAEILPFGLRAVKRDARSWRWMALAASVLLGVLAAAGIWIAVPDAELNQVLRDSKLRIRREAGIVSYAASCAFRGHRVPHLVVQTPSGPVTVMVLVHESVSRLTQFDEQGYRGTIMPMPGHGSIAVLMQNPGGAP